MSLLCSEPDCLKRKHAKGLCSKHYSQAVRTGQVEAERKHKVKRIYTGQSRSGAYKSYRHMLDRCYNPESPGYKYYGACGVRVCERWMQSFANFLKDMGTRPEGHSIDRIDGYGDYEPSNCRWADSFTQARNRNSKYKRLVSF